MGAGCQGNQLAIKGLEFSVLTLWPPGRRGLEIELITNAQYFGGFPKRLSGEESACSAGDRSSSPNLEDCPWRMAWQPTPVFLPGESHGQRSLVGGRATVHGVAESQTRLSRLSTRASTIHTLRYVSWGRSQLITPHTALNVESCPRWLMDVRVDYWPLSLWSRPPSHRAWFRSFLWGENAWALSGFFAGPCRFGLAQTAASHFVLGTSQAVTL